MCASSAVLPFIVREVCQATTLCACVSVYVTEKNVQCLSGWSSDRRALVRCAGRGKQAPTQQRGLAGGTAHTNTKGLRQATRRPRKSNGRRKNERCSPGDVRRAARGRCSRTGWAVAHCRAGLLGDAPLLSFRVKQTQSMSPSARQPSPHPALDLRSSASLPRPHKVVDYPSLHSTGGGRPGCP